MKAVINTVIFQIACILLFTLIYFKNDQHFSLPRTFASKQFKYDGGSEQIAILDCIYTSVTIQAGVGYNGLDPTTPRGKILIICQQLLMICSNIIIFYIFTIHIFSKL
jgi:hypothetical protein